MVLSRLSLEPSVAAAAFLAAGAAAAGLAAAAWAARRPLLRALRAPAGLLFHLAYYYAPERTWRNTWWMGRQVEKTPLDLWIYQEILHETRPQVLVECGTNLGGSAAYFASLFDLMGDGRVISIDVRSRERPAHPRIRYLEGSSTAPAVVEQVRALLRPGERVMVVLDSDHSERHVLQELRTYAPLVSVGQYLVVEDTNLNGHPVAPSHGPGPMEAVRRFLRESRDFEADGGREKFLMTFNPGGYLRRAR